MMHMFFDEKPWFAPKRFGYGAGLPIAWQGWAVLGAYIGVVTGAALWLAEQSLGAFLLVTIVATLPLLLIAARKTRGGWHWRWGDND